MDDELGRLIEQYRELAATTPATEFCRHVLSKNVWPLQAAVLLRDLYGLNLMECKKTIGACVNEMGHPTKAYLASWS